MAAILVVVSAGFLLISEAEVIALEDGRRESLGHIDGSASALDSGTLAP